MTILIHPTVMFESESLGETTQAVYDTEGANANITNYLEEKAALMVVTDSADNILLSILGQTKWVGANMAALGDDFDLGNLVLRHKNGALTETNVYSLGSGNERQWTPYIPALRYTPTATFSETIRQSGVAAKAFLLVDTRESYSASDISQWPVGLWDGSAPLNINGLPANVPYLEVSVGNTASSATLRLTDVNLDVGQSSVQTADPFLDIHFTNSFRDWSGSKAEIEAVLAGLTAVGKTIDEVGQKEAVAYT